MTWRRLVTARSNCLLFSSPDEMCEHCEAKSCTIHKSVYPLIGKLESISNKFPLNWAENFMCFFNMLIIKYVLLTWQIYNLG